MKERNNDLCLSVKDGNLPYSFDIFPHSLKITTIQLLTILVRSPHAESILVMGFVCKFSTNFMPHVEDFFWTSFETKFSQDSVIFCIIVDGDSKNYSSHVLKESIQELYLHLTNYMNHIKHII